MVEVWINTHEKWAVLMAAGYGPRNNPNFEYRGMYSLREAAEVAADYDIAVGITEDNFFERSRKFERNYILRMAGLEF